MDIRYALEPHPKSIFLAGPTPRSVDVPSWRPEALRILAERGFAGTVLVPETRDGKPHDEYDHQVHWEWEGLEQATVIAFWVPRELQTMPAFITNVEYGMQAASGKIVLGYPETAPKMSYFAALARRFHIPVFHSLYETMAEAILKANSSFGDANYNGANAREFYRRKIRAGDGAVSRQGD